MTGLRVDGNCPECNAEIWIPTSANLPTSGLAVASLVLGCLTLLTCATAGPLAVLFGLPGVITGHMATAQVSRRTHGGASSGLAIAGLIMSYIGLVLGVIGVLFFVLLFMGSMGGGGGGFTPAPGGGFTPAPAGP